jgi:putative drug/metabolite transporter DUF486
VQLKTIQEVITLAVFWVFWVLYLDAPIKWNHIVGFALIVAAVFVIFKKWWIFSRLPVLHLILKHREGSQGVLNLVSFRVMVTVVFQISQPSSNCLTGRCNPFWHFLTAHL